MRRILSIAVATSLLTLMAAPAVSAADTKLTIVPAGSVKWMAGTGEMKGNQVAVLAGDPAKTGSEYAVRLKIPDGAKIPPHFHTNLEEVTVISGTMLVGLGDRMDPSQMTALGPGSFVALPAGVHHYAMTKGVTVIELHGIGPESMTMVKMGKMPKM